MNPPARHRVGGPDRVVLRPVVPEVDVLMELGAGHLGRGLDLVEGRLVVVRLHVEVEVVVLVGREALHPLLELGVAHVAEPLLVRGGVGAGLVELLEGLDDEGLDPLALFACHCHVVSP